MSRKILFIYIFILLAIVSLSCFDNNFSDSIELKDDVTSIKRSPMNPHLPKKNSSWCEGWYYRITDHENDRTIAVIAGSYIPENNEYIPGMKLHGYLAIIIQEKNFKMQIYEAYLDNTFLLSNGDYLKENPVFSAPADFEWRAEGYGSLTQDSVDLIIPGVIHIYIVGKNRIPWNNKIEQAGPEGLLTFVNFLPLHWYVYSLGTETEYDIILFDKNSILNGSGYMHQEKNWAVSFPEAWVWSQGVSKNNSSHFALSGGIVPIGGKSLTTWLVGYFSDKIKWDFKITEPGTIFDWQIDACMGEFNFIAKNPIRTLKVKAQASIDSFVTVSIPTKDGFEPGAEESFLARLEISAYQHDPILGLFGLEFPIEKRIFRNAALEFGGSYRCSEQFKK